MLDFYLIVSDYRAAYGKRWLAVANRLIPPNVFYFEHDGLVAKYAVLSEADFDRLDRARDEQRLSVGAVRAAVAAGVGRGRGGARACARGGRARRRRPCLRRRGRVRTRAARLVAPGVRADLFGRAARRAQGAASSVVDLDPERYLRFTGPALKARERMRPHGSWALAADRGKGTVRRPPGQGEPDLRRRRGLHRVEDQSPRRAPTSRSSRGSGATRCLPRSAFCRGC